MRKYWKAIVITAAIILCIGTFHVNSARSAEPHPAFVIQTISGDANEIDSMVLEGSYINTSSMNYTSTNLNITSEGASYNSQSFLDQLIGHYPIEIQELQEEHRAFMRGKSTMIHLFFEDEDSLVYADADYVHTAMGPIDAEFEISVLNKGDGETHSFSTELPDIEGLHYVFVENVRVIEGSLYIITQNTVNTNDGFNEEMTVYEIDLASESITSHEVLLSISQWQEDAYTHLQLVENNPATGSHHIVLVRTEETMTDALESDRVTDRKQEILTYDFLTKQMETLDVPGLDLTENRFSFLEGESLYFTRGEEQELVVTPFRIGEDQPEDPYRIEFNTTIEYEDGPSLLIRAKEGKLYAVNQELHSELNGDVAVLDVQTGETLFKGEIALRNASAESSDYELHIYSIYLK